ncbi:MAG: hypothetical protein V2I33_26465 [Kangiellaceae bacterium]|nr:hypothetical protein [Kangiellaceae bacterium]
MNGALTGYGERGYEEGAYIGEFLDGERHGHGVYHGNEGSSYDGAWVHDRKEGPGTYTAPDGTVTVGTSTNDVFTPEQTSTKTEQVKPPTTIKN